MSLPNGLDALRAELQTKEVMRLIERTARWTSPDTFKLLPVWYPEHARKALFYKTNWTEPQMNTNRQTGTSDHKREGNTHANKALTLALGIRSKERPNWSCCHIWGVDDASYQKANEVVQDRRFFSCIANMVLLPTPLKAFTDTMPDVKAMLRICARNLYGWHCDHESVASSFEEISTWDSWEDYPESWPREMGGPPPPGVVPVNSDIQASVHRRLKRIRIDLDEAGPHYPRKEVQETLTYWNIDLPE